MGPLNPKEIHYYVRSDSSSPFLSWFESLTSTAQLRIRNRLNRIALGSLGKVKSVGEGVHELKFKDKSFPAFRIYFGNDGDTLIVLLLGGDKSNQGDDIALAKEYWNDYKQNK